MWWQFLLGGILATGGYAIVAALRGHPYEGQHAASSRDDPEDWPSDIGSMDLEAERGWSHPMSDDGWLPAPPWTGNTWR